MREKPNLIQRLDLGLRGLKKTDEKEMGIHEAYGYIEDYMTFPNCKHIGVKGNSSMRDSHIHISYSNGFPATKSISWDLFVQSPHEIQLFNWIFDEYKRKSLDNYAIHTVYKNKKMEFHNILLKKSEIIEGLIIDGKLLKGERRIDNLGYADFSFYLF